MTGTIPAPPLRKNVLTAAEALSVISVQRSSDVVASSCHLALMEGCPRRERLARPTPRDSGRYGSRSGRRR